MKVLNFRYLLFKLVDSVLSPTGYKLIRRYSPYLNAKTTINAADKAGVSINEYVESLWGQKGATDRVIQQMQKVGALSACEHMCEIGPGTGRYLERVLSFAHPRRYEIYETAHDWAAWLVRTYGVISMVADGYSLKYTPTRSCNLVHAHGVFTSLSFLNVFKYFEEMIRITCQDGYLIFDFLDADHFNNEIIQRYLKSQHHHWGMIPNKLIHTFFLERGCEVIHEFDNEYACSYSHYVILKKVNL